MTHSLICADRYSDFKVAAVALISAILLVAVGLVTRMGNHEGATARLHLDGPVVKVGQPLAVDIF